MKKLILIAFVGCSFALGCSDDGGSKTNNAENNNNANNDNNDDNNGSLGTWMATFNGEAVSGDAVQPFYSAGNDHLSISLQNGSEPLPNLNIEIDGINFGFTGTVTHETHTINISGGGSTNACSLFNGEFSITFEEVTCTSAAATSCKARGNFDGILSCAETGATEIEGSFLR